MRLRVGAVPRWAQLIGFMIGFSTALAVSHTRVYLSNLNALQGERAAFFDNVLSGGSCSSDWYEVSYMLTRAECRQHCHEIASRARRPPSVPRINPSPLTIRPFRGRCCCYCTQPTIGCVRCRSHSSISHDACNHVRARLAFRSCRTTRRGCWALTTVCPSRLHPSCFRYS